MALKLSFILPCYNVEHYIADCLDSIYAQNMSEEDYEVICVNDCSTDGTRSVIVDYLQRHSNLILIDHENNMSVGEARNTGIRQANGEYIWFVDADDMIVLNSAKAICEIAMEKDVDVLMFNYETVDETNRHIKKDTSFSDSDVLVGQDFVVKYYSNQFSRLAIVWRCLFRTSFLRKNELWYSRMLKAEDVIFLWKAILIADRVVSVSGICYVYRRNPHSVTKKELNACVAFSERVLFAYEISRLLENDVLQIKAIIRDDMERVLMWCVNSNSNLIQQMTIQERNRYYDEIKSNWEAVSVVRPYMNRKHKRLFSISGGRKLWLLNVKALMVLNEHNKKE